MGETNINNELRQKIRFNAIDVLTDTAHGGYHKEWVGSFYFVKSKSVFCKKIKEPGLYLYTSVADEGDNFMKLSYDEFDIYHLRDVLSGDSMMEQRVMPDGSKQYWIVLYAKTYSLKTYGVGNTPTLDSAVNGTYDSIISEDKYKSYPADIQNKYKHDIVKEIDITDVAQHITPDNFVTDDNLDAVVSKSEEYLPDDIKSVGNNVTFITDVTRDEFGHLLEYKRMDSLNTRYKWRVYND